MDIKTKFDIGDTVFYGEHTLHNFTVEEIVIDKHGIHYKDDEYRNIAEKDCMNKKEVLDHINNKF